MSCTVELTPLQVEALAAKLWSIGESLPSLSALRAVIVSAGTVKPTTPTAGATFPPSWVDDVQFEWAGDTGACVMLFPDCAEAPYVSDQRVMDTVSGASGVKRWSVLGPNMMAISKRANIERLDTEAVIKDALRGAFLQRREAAHA